MIGTKAINPFINVEHSFLEETLHKMLLKQERKIISTIVPQTWKPPKYLVDEIQTNLWIDIIYKKI